MPALVLFRRRYRIASDDLHLPALWLAGLRLFGACVVLLYLIQVEARSHPKCQVRHGFAVLLGCVAFVGASVRLGPLSLPSILQEAWCFRGTQGEQQGNCSK